jgi:hypothetical protein
MIFMCTELREGPESRDITISTRHSISIVHVEKQKDNESYSPRQRPLQSFASRYKLLDHLLVEYQATSLASKQELMAFMVTGLLAVKYSMSRGLIRTPGHMWW